MLKLWLRKYLQVYADYFVYLNLCDSIEKEVMYTMEFMGQIKAGREVKTEEFKAEITGIQEENV